jgi:hypothetical protein
VWSSSLAPDFSKGGRRPHHGDEGDLLLKAIAEADEEDIDQLSIENRVPKFVELIGCRFDPLTVDGERGVSLNGVAELGVEAGDARLDVVLEELTEGRPMISRSGGVVEHQIENLD